MTTRQAVAFENRRGQRLHGILELPPEDVRKPVAILILSPGVKMRVGPHRLYNKLSRVLTAAGYPVLRFDFFGLGDSEGEVPGRQLADVYNGIQDGAYVEDTLDAMNWMELQQGISRFILSGLCGGAITGLLCGSEDSRVEALLALGLINVFEGGEENYSKFVTDGAIVELLLPGYIAKLTDPASWKRLLTFKSDFRSIFRLLTMPIKSRIQRARQTAAPAVKVPAELLAPVADEASNVNPKFAPAFYRMLTHGKPMLLVFSQHDRLVHEFTEKFENRYKAFLEPYRSLYELVIIKQANHILSAPGWEAEMHDQVRRWLGDFERLPAAGGGQ